MAYFPMFIEMENQDCLIVGGGFVAMRKAEVLLDFKARLTVIAPSILDKIRELPGVLCIEREFSPADVDNRFLVVAATEDKALNHKIARLCMERSIYVNAVDQIEDCSFIFPSYLKAGDVVAAFGSSGKSPVLTQYLKNRMRELLEEDLGGYENMGPIADFMGEMRPRIKDAFGTEKERKQVYKKLLSECLKKGGPISGRRAEEWIQHFKEQEGRGQWTE